MSKGLAGRSSVDARRALLFVSLLLLLCSGVAVTSAIVPQQSIPPGYTLGIEGLGVKLYHDTSEARFVQEVDLGRGASVTFRHGAIVQPGTGLGPYGGNDPRFAREPLSDTWTSFAAADENAFCLSNGQFFSTNEYPTPLAFSLKKDDVIVSDGYGVAGPREEFPGQKLMLELWAGRADIVELTRDNLYLSDAPNIIAGLSEDANKGPSNSVGRTFIGINDVDGDGLFETVLILSSKASTQPDAANILRNFGADKVMMLDGGASTQLVCRDKAHISSSRTVPQTIAVSAARPLTGSIAFVIDDTGSMGEEIDDVKTTVTQKVDEFSARSLTFDYHLITYKDDVTYRGHTADPATIKTWVNGLSATGGGDCPEEMLGALNRLAEEAPDSQAWVMTDAGFHGDAGDVLVTIYNLVRAHVRVHPIVYSWCFARGEQGATTDDESRAATLGGESFAQIASETGGHYFRIESDETLAATDILLNEMTAPSDLMLFRDELTGEAKSYAVNVDATADSVNLLLNIYSGSADLELRDPSGALVGAGSPGVTVTTLGNVRYVEVTTPAPGQWHAKVSGTASFALSASGETAVDLQYLADTTLTSGVTVPLRARLSGPVASTNFQLIRPDGSVLTGVSLFDDGLHNDAAAGDGLYGGSYTPNAGGSYFLHVYGTLTAGGLYSRTSPETIRVSALRVVAPGGQTGRPGARLTYQFTVSNKGSNADTVDLTATSSHGWIVTPPPASLSLAGNETRQVAVTLAIPSGVSGGEVDELVLAIASRANPLANDAAAVQTTVGLALAPIYLPVALQIPYVPPAVPLLNGNFEAGPVNWTEYSNHHWPIILNSDDVEGLPVRSGRWAAWLGGEYNEIAFIGQTVTVPADRPFLTYYHLIASQDQCSHDFGGVLVNDEVVDMYDLCDPADTGGYVLHAVNLSAYAGQTVDVQIRVETDGSLNSNLFVDDVGFSANGAARAETSRGEGPRLELKPARLTPRVGPAAATQRLLGDGR